MDDSKRRLKGSEKRDIFKQMHKSLNASFYALDIDFCLISKHPPGVVALLDYKDPNDHVTFSEALFYGWWLDMCPVPIYIVEASDPKNGPFTIKEYLGGDYHPEPPVITWGMSMIAPDWEAFGKWERELRTQYWKNGGWK